MQLHRIALAVAVAAAFSFVVLAQDVATEAHLKADQVAHSRSIYSGTLFAQFVDVQCAWGRATVLGQKVTGTFMKNTAKEGAELVAVSMTAAGAKPRDMTAMDNDMKNI